MLSEYCERLCRGHV